MGWDAGAKKTRREKRALIVWLTALLVTLSIGETRGGNLLAASTIELEQKTIVSYEAYGMRTAEQGSSEDRQKANTKDEDPTGLLNEGMRYRCLTTGVFLTRDPAGFVDGPNVYTYVRQIPWSAYDPEGLWLGLVVDAGFAVYDTVQYASGKISRAYNFGRTIGENFSPTGAIVNTYNALGEAGYQLFKQGSPLGAVGAVAGIASSLLSGEIFHLNQNQIDPNNRQTFIPGLFVNDGVGQDLTKYISQVTGQGTNYVSNPQGFFGLGNIVSTLLGEAKIPSIPSIWLAQALRETGGGGVFAWSNGANIANTSKLFLIDNSILKNSHGRAWGPQTLLGGSQWGSVKNFINQGDPVPYLSPWNWFRLNSATRNEGDFGGIVDSHHAQTYLGNNSL